MRRARRVLGWIVVGLGLVFVGLSILWLPIYVISAASKHDFSDWAWGLSIAGAIFFMGVNTFFVGRLLVEGVRKSAAEPAPDENVAGEQP